MHEVFHRQQHEVAFAKGRVRQHQLLAGMDLALHPHEVAVDGALAVAALSLGALAAELVLHVQEGVEQNHRRQLGANLDHGVGDPRGDAVGGVGLVGVAHAGDAGERDGVDEARGTGDVAHAVAHVGAQRHVGAARVGVGHRPIGVERLRDGRHIMNAQDTGALGHRGDADAGRRRVASGGLGHA